MKIIENASGDTIVEVLIAIVIISLILTGAYVTANDSLRSIRDAQEHVQALGYAQNQAEDLRAEANSVFQGGNNVTYLNPPAKPFCFDANNQFTDYTNPTAPSTCTNSFYTAKIQSLGEANTVNANISTYSFDITVTWPSLSPNSPNDQVTIYYRVGV